MKTTIIKILDLLSPKERRKGVILLGMILISALLDMTGVASIMPFIAVLTNPEVVHSNTYLNYIYHGLSFTDSNAFLFFLGVIFFTVLVTSIAFKAITNYLLLRFSNMQNYSISRRLVSGYLQHPYDWFLNRHSADLGKSILAEAGQVVSGSLIPMMQIIAQSAVVVALITLLFIVDPFLTFTVAAGLGGAYALIYILMRRYLGRLGESRFQATKERFQIVQECFGGIKDVKVSGLEEVFVNRFELPAIKLARVGASFQSVSMLPRYLLEAVVFGGMLLIVLYLMAGTGDFQKTIPVLALYAFAGYRLMPALQQIYNQLTNLRFSGPSLDVLHKDLMALSCSDHDSTRHQQNKRMKFTQEIVLEDISYIYPGAENAALDKLTLNISVHTTVGFVGSTGSGKTTTVDLILGLLQPHQGKLRIDDTDITIHNIRTWQNTIGYVPQHIYLADDSVSGNIAFGVSAENINHEAVERASRIANLHDFVTKEMQNGYDTLVGERGVRLSGGQRQRIGIARALYHDPEVLILDEATSALDNLTEQAVMEAVHNIGHRKTIIIIAHRLSTVRECDKIFLLDHGQLIASGTYNELIDNSQRFKSMAGLTN